MTVTYTPRLGLPQWGAGSDTPPTRDGLNAAFDALEDRATSFTVGPIDTAGSPVAGAFRWDGQVLWWADPTMADPDDGTIQGWAPISSDAYIDVRQYGAVPLTVTRPPAPPAPTTPPNYDPYAVYRAADAGPGIQAALDAALADAAAVQFPGRWRRRKPIFIPPGDYAMFTRVLITGDPSSVSISDVSIIGAWPSTRLIVFDDVEGTDGAGAPVNKPGFPDLESVFRVDGRFDVVHVSGLVFDAYTPGTRVEHAVSAESDVSVDFRDILTEEHLVCKSGAVDGSHGPATTDLEKTPSRFKNITARSPILPAASRNGIRTYDVGAVGARTLCAVSAGSGSGAVVENVHAVGCDYGILISEFGSRGYSGPDVHVAGLACDGVAIADIWVQQVRRFDIIGYRSVGGARSFRIDQSNAMIRGSISGVFDAAVSGFGATESATERADVAVLGSGVSSIAQLDLVGFCVFNAGAQASTIRCSGIGPANHIHMIQCEWPNSPDQIMRVASGSAPTFTYTGLRQITGSHVLVHVSLDKFTPAPGLATVGVPTSTSATGIVITDASTGADVAKVLGELVRSLKAKGFLP